jgi:hypothetical protein
LIHELKSRPDVPSRNWPTDAEVRNALLGAALYGALNARRVRMVLRAIDDLLWERTGGKAEGYALADTLHIEHLLPQSWEENWVPHPPDGLAEHEQLDWRQAWIEERRDRRNIVLHSIGNLTLLTEPLNLEVSKRPLATEALVDR